MKPAQMIALMAILALPAAAQTAVDAVVAPVGADLGAVTSEGPAVGAGTEVEALAPLDRWRAEPWTIFDAVDVNLADFLWTARPVVVFADSPNDPAFQRQIDLLTARPEPLADRDVVILADADPSAMTELRRTLRPRGFMLAIIDKDGGVKLRKPFPWDVREITRSIDKMPLRLQELRERREGLR